MINNNKILTVSYGTFSCTLEGFDDSFGTMKAIAEYFRDLAADDRYFGAEPAQPDAQMLARIAQREISRHVEAREDDGRIVLSAQEKPGATGSALSMRARNEDVEDAHMEDTATSDASATPTAAEHTPETESAGPSTPPQTDDKVEDAAPEQEADETCAEDCADDQVTNDDSRVDTQAAAPEETAEEVAADAPDTSPTEASAPVVETGLDTAGEDDIVPSLPDADVEAFFTDSLADDETAIEDSIEDKTEETKIRRAASDSIAEKLKRIRAVVSQQSEAAGAPDYSEDQHADPAVTNVSGEEITESAFEPVVGENEAERQNEVVAATLRDIEDALDADDAVEAPASDDRESENDDVAAILSRLDREAETETGEDDTDADTYEADEDTDENILASLAGYDTPMSDEDDSFQDDMIDLAGAAQDDALTEEDNDSVNLFEAGKADAEADGAKTTSEVPTTAPAPRTRVLKVKRATLEAAIKGGQLEEYYDEDDVDDASEEPSAQTYRKAPLADRSSLSAAEEDELARELAELEADMGASRATPAAEQDIGDETADEPENAQEQPDPESTPSQPPRTDMSGTADMDFSRLMAETDNQMEEPESATRRDAFTHLRAAVVAKKADEAVGGTVSEKDADEAYRDDLASVVRPRRPVATERGRTTERPAEHRTAPLRLVAEQRIDVQKAQTAIPVRPRRVATISDAPPVKTAEDVGSFEDFVDEVGAHKLPDLLEAAAAYLAFVEGQQNFSRPQLMNKVRQVEKDNFTREDGLRSFGKLLREGKIEKLKGGRFQVSEQIGFKPDARAAG